MAIFSALDYEYKVQVGDKTRFDCTKVYVTAGSPAPTIIRVTPGTGATVFNIYNADPLLWYLDYQFDDFSIDIDSLNNSIVFNEGGADITTTVASGNKSLSTLATQVAAAMTSAGTQTYTAVLGSDQKITISAASAFVVKASSAMRALGFTEDTGSANSQTSDVVQSVRRIITVFASNGAGNHTRTFNIDVYNALGDRLFADDSFLVSHEADIMKWVPARRNSFLDVHRRAQDTIIGWLDRQGYVNVYQEKFDKFDLVDLEEVRNWAGFIALRLIFEGLSNAKDDIFADKKRKYEALEIEARQRAILRIDTDKDGSVENIEGMSISTMDLFRR